MGSFRQWMRGFVHNCIVHPLIPFLPHAMGDWLHETNGRWAYGEGGGDTDGR